MRTDGLLALVLTMSPDEPLSCSGLEVLVGLERVISFPSSCSELLEKGIDTTPWSHIFLKIFIGV